MELNKIRKELLKTKNKKKIEILKRFFKTNKGDYGEGDEFLSGTPVPNIRKIAKKYQDLDFKNLEKLIKSKFHEERLVAVLILVKKYEASKKEKNEKSKKKIFNFYLNNTKYINNWDLVDISCYKIIGDYLIDKKNQRKILYKLAKSKKEINTGWQWLWERRISIISTFTFIKNNDFSDALKISKLMLNEKHDLLHKAVGWMLREIGKKEEKVLTKFLKENYLKLPRTTLRYAIEKYPCKKRKEILAGIFN